MKNIMRMQLKPFLSRYFSFLDENESESDNNMKTVDSHYDSKLFNWILVRNPDFLSDWS